MEGLVRAQYAAFYPNDTVSFSYPSVFGGSSLAFFHSLRLSLPVVHCNFEVSHLVLLCLCT